MHRLVFIIVLSLLSQPGSADPAILRNGSDSFIASASNLPVLDAPGDVFASGANVLLRGRAAGDIHAMGFSVDIELSAPQDVYAMGGSVTLRAPVDGNVTLSGMTLHIAEPARIGGNARLAGGSVVIDGPIGGALTATGGSVALNGVIGGDVLVQAGDITFGPDARISGRLVYLAPAPITIPATVIGADRVTFRQSEVASTMRSMHDDWRLRRYPSVPGALALFWGWLVTLGFLTAVAALTLSAAPDLTERLRQSVAMRPGFALLTGFAGLALLVGLIPVAAVTILGIPLIPIAVLGIILFWTIGYLLGAHTIAARLRMAFGVSGNSFGTQLLATMGVIVALSVLNFIPVAGWILNLAVMLAGLGGIFGPLFDRLGASLPPQEPGTAA